MVTLNEADTCREYVLPKLEEAGWSANPLTFPSFGEQHTFTDGRIVVTGETARRRAQKRADYLLRYTADFPIAVVEAKRRYAAAGDGLQQAKQYAEILGLSFAYATNGREIVEFDFLTGQEQQIADFPSPDDLWARYRNKHRLTEDTQAERFQWPSYRGGRSSPRYYQEIAINRTVLAVLQGRRRLLLTMATGTGKTLVAFQICWKLWNSRWNRADEYRRPRILNLSDRNILVDQPIDNDFAPFEGARKKIEGGVASKSWEMNFATYQAIAEDERRPGLYRRYARNFFDLIIVDECHRGSAARDSTWREILEYFEPAVQLGMTATPLRDESRNTYEYFGAPVYQYSLRQGIADGFLAPYRLHRIMTTADEEGWRPGPGERDRYGREIPDEEYQTRDFERAVALRARTLAIANHITEFMKQIDRFAKTIVFCVDQQHALDMREALTTLNADLVRRYPDYVARVTAMEGKIGRGHLSNFQDLEKTEPIILTTSQLLTTGVDVPTCKNVVLVRVINSMSEFKQIIGRGTRVRADYGKLFFNILDYTGSASRMFADPEFDGDPVVITEEQIDDFGRTREDTKRIIQAASDEDSDDGDDMVAPGDDLPRKLFYDGGRFKIANHVLYELDPDGDRLRVMAFTDYTADKVRTLWPSALDLQRQWSDLDQRSEVRRLLAERGIDLDSVALVAGQPDADPLDLRVTWPLTRRSGRAGSVRTGCATSARTSSSATARRLAPSWTPYWKSTPSSG